MIMIDSCIIWFHLDCILQLRKSYYIATNVSSRKSATTFGDLPDWWKRYKTVWILWRYKIATFSVISVLCEGNPLVTGGSPRTGQWRGALLFSLICAWINGWANNPETGDLLRHRALYDVTVLHFRQIPYLLDQNTAQLIYDATMILVDWPYLGKQVSVPISDTRFTIVQMWQNRIYTMKK